MWRGHLPVSLPTLISLYTSVAFILPSNICIPQVMAVTWVNYKRELSSLQEPCPKLDDNKVASGKGDQVASGSRECFNK